MFASDASASTPSRLRMTYQRKASEPLLSPIQSPQFSGQGHPTSSTYTGVFKPKRRSSNPLTVAKAHSRTTAASLTLLLILAWFILSGSSPTSGKLKDFQLANLDENSVQPLFKSLHGKGHTHAPSIPIRSISRSTVTASHVDEEPLNMLQELAALALFLTSSHSHILPADLDPSLPLDPTLVLDTLLPVSGAARQAALHDMEDEVWEDFPVVVFGKHEAWTNEVSALLHGEEYFGKNGQGLTIVRVDGRTDTPVLSALLTRLTQQTLPVILVGGVPFSHSEFMLQHDDGHLAHLLERVGARLGRDAEKRKLKERQRELTGRKAVL